MTKQAGAFLTIGELSDDLGIAQHILRYWETRFRQLQPLKRAGNRRYYRPDDVALVTKIHRLLNEEGYTIKGVQRLLAGKGAGSQEPAPIAASAPAVVPDEAVIPSALLDEIKSLRAKLAAALAD